MFGFGVWELAIIVGVVLIVLGPTVLPRLGRRMGDMVIGARQAADQLSESMTAELDEKKDEESEKPKLTDGSSERSSSSGA